MVYDGGDREGDDDDGDDVNGDDSDDDGRVRVQCREWCSVEEEGLCPGVPHFHMVWISRFFVSYSRCSPSIGMYPDTRMDRPVFDIHMGETCTCVMHGIVTAGGWRRPFIIGSLRASAALFGYTSDLIA